VSGWGTGLDRIFIRRHRGAAHPERTADADDERLREGLDGAERGGKGAGMALKQH